MNTVSNRHEGHLGGQLVSWERRRSIRVQIVLDDNARHVAVQHATWMLVNLLARMDGVVSKVSISGPAVRLAQRVVPLGGDSETNGESTAVTLLDAVLAAAAAIDAVPVVEGVSSEVDVAFELGPGLASAGRIRVHGDGWAGGVAGQVALPMGRWSSLPFGPYTAACLAAGRVFLLSRAPEIAAENDLGQPLLWSTWSLRCGSVGLLADGPAELGVTLDAGLAGVGAVGTAAMHAAWATRGLGGRLLVVDADRRGVDETNLNRGVLFIRASVGHPKACDAVARLAFADIGFDAREGRYQEQPGRPGLLLSAVDTNSAREALQAQYPARVIGASTHGLRAELLRTGPAGAGACLRCYNEPEAPESDEALRTRIGQAAPAELAAVAARAGISVQDARDWLRAGGCGAIDSAMLRALRDGQRDGDEDGEFAVAFVSAFAGTLLAAEVAKEALGAAVPLSDSANRISFQFFRPRAANGARFLARDPTCPACRPGPGRDAWTQRREQWGPDRR